MLAREKEKEEKEREERLLTKEREEKEKEKQRQHEIEMKRLELELLKSTNTNSTSTTSSAMAGKIKTPNLPSFIDYKDDLDSYLSRFERFAKSNNWDKDTWAVLLSALLTGRALDVYSRLSEDAASNYDLLKEALLKRYDLTESGFRNRFRISKPEYGETCEQYIVRLGNYLNRWIELSNTDQTFDSLFELMIKEQFLASCSANLAIYLRERGPSSLDEISKLADQYLVARNQTLASKVSSNADSKPAFTSKYSKQSFEERNKRKSFQNPTATFHTANQKFQLKCTFCSLPHKSENCRKIQSMTVQERRDLVKQSGACFVCLKRGNHIAKQCLSRKMCDKCSKSHHTVLCDENTSKNTPDKDEGSASPSVSASSIANQNSQILLMTASVHVEGTSGRQEARLLIDGGSQRSYIRTSLAKATHAKTLKKETLQIQSFGEQSNSCSLDLVSVNVASKFDSFVSNFKLLSTSTLCSPLETIPSGPWISELEERGFYLADEIQTSPGSKRPIDIVLGADQMWKVFTWNTFSTSFGIIASETKFGWVLQGPISQDSYAYHNATTTNTFFAIDVSKFWELETIGIADGDQEYSTVQNFNSQIEREEDGRYKVPLLWKDTEKTLEPSIDVAKHRLKCLNRRFEKDPGLKREYSRVFEEYETLDIIEKVPCTELQKEKDTFYLPHHAVVREQSTSTKVRPVFDGSAKDKKGNSLNDLLDPGPSLLPLLIGLLLRFRLYAVAFSGDITKAFLQVLLKEDDRDYVRFFWNESVYRFKRVCFGITCAPFLLNATIRYHLKSFGKELTDKMLRSFYVDDLVMGSKSVENSVVEIVEAIAIMKEACMSLTKWTTSSQPLARRLKSDFGIDAQYTGVTKILGVLWNLDTDELELEIPRWGVEGMYTKRTILSYAAKFFDPYGFSAPIVVSLKLFIRYLWDKGYEWDTILTPEDCERFQSLLQSISLLDKISVPRFFFNSHIREANTLHLFCDASEQAYCALIYIQTRSPDDERSSNLLISKTRLAPVKRITLPRLELLACFIGAKLLKKVMDELTFSQPMTIFCWSDSTIAINWIRSPASKFKQFVSNRVQFIQSITSPSNWNFCPGTQNPADQATRSSSFKKWDKCLWFHGPSWLNCLEEWPTMFPHIMETPPITEERKIVNESDVNDSCMLHNSIDTFFDLTRFSTFRTLVNVFTFVRKAVINFKRLIHKDLIEDERLTATPHEEYETSVSQLIRMEQEKFFSSEITALKRGDKISPKSPLKNLHVGYDNGYLVSLGRINFDALVILPRNSHLTKLLILKIHISLSHGGISATLTELRSQYWIINGRRTVRSALRSCFQCALYSAKSYSQKEAPLMDYRLKKRNAFEITGCDYAGPFYPKEGGKVYILIFTCTVTRAIHLELCLSQNLEDFLLAFRRFSARFNSPNVVVSDNAKTFKAAKESLKSILDWRFTPEFSPSWGGLWERLIRSIKNSLRKILQSQKVSCEILRTVLYEIESGINKRPLTYLSEDREDLRPLRPIDFISGTSIEVAESGSDTSSLRKNFKQKVHIVDRLWDRWRSEYLLELRSWNKKKQQGKNIPKVGDVVLVDPKTFKSQNRSLWPLGRILKLYPGKDSFPRCALVLCQGSISRRNTGSLFPLEVVESDDS